MKLFKDALNNIYAYELDGSQDDLIGDKTPITQEEANQINSQKKISEFESFTYAEKRKEEYPSIEDQLDIMYHNGFDAWKTVITAVKEKYPKLVLETSVETVAEVTNDSV